MGFHRRTLRIEYEKRAMKARNIQSVSSLDKNPTNETRIGLWTSSSAGNYATTEPCDLTINE